jgi:hypothetical protein
VSGITAANAAGELHWRCSGWHTAVIVTSAMSWCRLAEIAVATIVIAVAFTLALPFFLTLATLFVGGP